MPKHRSPGEGSCYKLKTGGWRAAITVTGADGTTRRMVRRGRTKRDALDAIARLRLELAKPIPTANPRATLADYLNAWLTDRKAPAVNPRSLATYRYSVARLTAYLGAVTLDKLSPPVIQHALTKMQTERQYSPRTIQQTRTVLTMALGDARADGLLATNPTARTVAPRAERANLSILTEEQIAALLASTSDPLQPLWALLVSTGLRISEALGLRWADVDFERNVLHVTVQLVRTPKGSASPFAIDDPKSRSSRRVLPLIPQARAALERQREWQGARWAEAGGVWRNDWGLVWTHADGRPWHMEAVRKAFAAALARADLPTLTPHGLRHTAATLWLREGVPLHVVSALLGHANVAVTGNTYAHVTPRMMDDAAVRMAAALRPK